MKVRLYFSQRRLLALRVMHELNVQEGEMAIMRIIAVLDQVGAIDVEKARDVAQAFREEKVRP